MLTKDAGTSKGTPWHHDQSYYPLDGDVNLSIWIPIDPVPMWVYVLVNFLWAKNSPIISSCFVKTHEFPDTVQLCSNRFERTSHYYPLLPKSVIANIYITIEKMSGTHGQFHWSEVSVTFWSARAFLTEVTLYRLRKTDISGICFGEKALSV